MKEILIAEIKSVQLNILKQIAIFCDQNNIRYFLGYGTLIGAIRHKGYIPWDDDIDIIMPRGDYNRFVKEFNKSNKIFKLVDISNNTLYELPYAKVYDTRTEMIEGMYKPVVNYGVYIDVFPIDGYGSKLNLSTIHMLSKFLNAKKAIYDSKRKWYKSIIILLGKFFLMPFTVSMIIKLMNNLATKFDYDKSMLVNSMFSPYCMHEMCPKSWLENSIEAEFEGDKYKIPIYYDEYLKNIYGEYMKLPPKEKQVTHHVFKAWWKE
jgi:lipopolysaccharide cholinephosphotransferase